MINREQILSFFFFFLSSKYIWSHIIYNCWCRSPWSSYYAWIHEQHHNRTEPFENWNPWQQKSLCSRHVCWHPIWKWEFYCDVGLFVLIGCYPTWALIFYFLFHPTFFYISLSILFVSGLLDLVRPFLDLVRPYAISIAFIF